VRTLPRPRARSARRAYPLARRTTPLPRPFQPMRLRGFQPRRADRRARA
jgi:hypothetical protein